MEYKVELKSAHLIVPSDIAKEVFSEEPTAYVAFKEETSTLLLSRKSNAWFSKLHKSSEILLKSKDLIGTKSLAIKEILIDHELDQSNKTLSCEINHDKQFLKIKF